MLLLGAFLPASMTLLIGLTLESFDGGAAIQVALATSSIACEVFGDMTEGAGASCEVVGEAEGASFGSSYEF